MLRDITLGQYYPADSVIHKLDPRVKLFATLIYIISLFCFKGIAALLVATVFLIFCIRTSKVPFKFMVKGLKAIVVLMLITAAFNLFLTPGTPIVKFWIFKITAGGAECDSDGDPPDLSDSRNFNHDTYDDTKPAHGRSGKITDAVIKDRCSGACYRYDDVYRAAVYPDPDRGDGQNHESTDGERC